MYYKEKETCERVIHVIIGSSPMPDQRSSISIIMSGNRESKMTLKLGQDALVRRPTLVRCCPGNGSMDRQFIFSEDAACEKKLEERDVTEDNEAILTPPVSSSIPSSSSVFQGGGAL